MAFVALVSFVAEIVFFMAEIFVFFVAEIFVSFVSHAWCASWQSW